MILSYSKKTKIFLIILSMLFMVFSIYSIIDELFKTTQFNIPFTILCCFIFLFSFFLLLGSKYYKIHINDIEIKREFLWLKKSIKIKNISKIWILKDAIYTDNGKKKIGITFDLQNQREAIIFILEKLKERKEVKIVTAEYLKNWIGEIEAEEFMKNREEIIIPWYRFW